MSIDHEHTEPTPGHVDECFNLSLSASSSASGLWAFTWLPAPPQHTSFVEFDTNGGVVGDGSFLIRDEFAGPLSDKPRHFCSRAFLRDGRSSRNLHDADTFLERAREC